MNGPPLREKRGSQRWNVKGRYRSSTRPSLGLHTVGGGGCLAGILNAGVLESLINERATSCGVAGVRLFMIESPAAASAGDMPSGAAGSKVMEPPSTRVYCMTGPC